MLSLQHYAGTPERFGTWRSGPHQFLADDINPPIFNPGGGEADYAHFISLTPPMFFKLRHPCSVCVSLQNLATFFARKLYTSSYLKMRQQKKPLGENRQQ